MGRSSTAVAFSAAFSIVFAACSPPPESDEAKGSTSSAVSVNTDKVEGQFFLTTFGGPDDSGDNGQLACGGTSDPSSDDVHQKYYAAAKQRFGCGTHIRVEANGNCIVLETTDTGPAAWVEDKAGGPVLDATPLAAEVLFNASSFGWSDRKAVQLTIADAQTPLGPCTASGDNGSASSTGSTDPSPDPTTSTGDDDDDDDDDTTTDPTPTCQPKTASAACRAAKTSSAAQCGVVPDGCKGTVSCDSQPGFGCAEGQTCVKNRCQAKPAPASSGSATTQTPAPAKTTSGAGTPTNDSPSTSANPNANADANDPDTKESTSPGSGTPPKPATKSASAGCSAAPTSGAGAPPGLGFAGIAGALAFFRRRRRDRRRARR